MGVLLFALALILLALLGPIGLLVTFAYNLLRYGVRYGVKRLNLDLKVIAIVLDQSGNVVCKDLFNLILRTKNGYSFGNRRETVSSCIGKNKQMGTLTKLGRALDWVLNALDPNHSIKSIDQKV